MKIRSEITSLLITNDDGISELLAPTARILGLVAGNVTIVVPTQNRSGCSAAISLNQPIEIRRGGDIEGKPVWTVSGLPNDGVRYALRELCSDAQAVVSGINDGWNLGYSVINSGTIGGAMEGVRFGRSGIALSAPFGFRAANADDVWRGFVQRLVERLLRLDELKTGGPVLLNVNLPEVFAPNGEIPRVLDVSRVEYEEWYEFESTKKKGQSSVILRGQRMKPDSEVEDIQALNAGCSVINVIATSWSVDAASVRVAIERFEIA